MKRTLRAIRNHPWAIILATAYLVLGTIYSVVNPIHEATDELRHYRYVRYIADLHQLPVQSGEQGNAQAHHPPLYYATAALVSFWVHPQDPLYEPVTNPHWSFRNWEVGVDNKNLYLHGPDEAWPYHDASLATHLARWMTLLWGVGVVLLTYASLHLIFPDRTAFSVLGTALVAFNPMFLYLGAAVNNDVPAGLAGAAILYASLCVVRDGLTTRRAMVLGVLYGLALLVKFNLLAMVGVIGLAFLLALLRSPEGGAQHAWLRQLAGSLGISVVMAGILAGWWYVRNTILYGEPTGFIRLTEIWGFREPGTGIALAWPELRYAWTSLWGRFGYGQIPMDGWIYAVIAVLCGSGLLGVSFYLVRAKLRNDLAPVQWRMLALLAASMLINFLVLFAYITVSPAGAMGRFFFPGLSAFIGLIALGLLGNLPGKVAEIAAPVLAAALLALPVGALAAYLAPAYAIPAQADIPADALDVQFGEHIRLLSIQADTASVIPGGQVTITATWQVLQPTDVPYTLFVHALDTQGVIAAQRDTYTGLGNYPSQWWRPGHIFSETYRMFVPVTAYAPEETELQIGFYNPERGRLPVSGSANGDDAYRIAQLLIEGDPDSRYPNQTYVNFGNQFALVGYTTEPRALRPSDSTTLTLYWQALTPSQEEKQLIFAQVLSGWDRVAGTDGEPNTTPSNTRRWEPGQVYIDTRTIVIPPDTAPGMYELWVGWFGADGGPRLKIIADDGRFLDDYLVLGNLRVLAGDE